MKKLDKECYIVFPHAKTLFLLRTDCDGLIEKLRIYYGDAFCYSVPGIVDYQILIIIYNKGELLVPLTDYKIKSNNLDLILSEILRCIRHNICLEESYNSYHASCVRIGKKSFMFVGGTSSGKTTFSTYLSLAHNSDVISEDITLINHDNCSVVPLRRPLFIRSASYKLLRDDYGVDFQNPEFISYSGGERILVRNTNKCLQCEINLNAILFLKLNPNHLSLDVVNGFDDLLENSYSSGDFYKNVCSALAITGKVPTYKFNYYNLGAAYEMLKKI